MNLLAFDTSTEVMSVAVQRSPDDPDQALSAPRLWQHSGPGGALTSAHLIPCIESLMAQAGLQFGQLDAIAFGRGPGSFTGLRTACAVAQGLAFGANVKVLPIDTLLAVAEEARYQSAGGLLHFEVLALLDARMDQLYGAGYAFERGHWRQTQDDCLLHPQDLVWDGACTLAGNVFAAYGTRLPALLAQRVQAMPSASALLRLAPALLAGGAAVRAELALPHYIRDKVAQTSSERAAQKAAL